MAQTDDEARAIVARICERVGLKANQLDRYPHQFSGGQRQRIGIARALVSNPEFIRDELVSALDVSIQAQIIALLLELKREMGLTYLFISHDISVIGYLADRVAVMYLGEIREMGPVEAIPANPRHPYTQSLDVGGARGGPCGPARRGCGWSAICSSPLNPPAGCKFRHPLPAGG